MSKRGKGTNLPARAAQDAVACVDVSTGASAQPGGYEHLVGGITAILESARRTSARTVNAIMTATYWEIGRRIVEFEQKGERRAEYGEKLLQRLAEDLSSRWGRGFGVDNLQRFRLFYLAYPTETIYATLSRKSSAPAMTGQGKYATAPRISGQRQIGAGGSKSHRILQTLSAKSPAQPLLGESSAILQTPSEEFQLARIATRFPLPWSAYVRLLAVKNEHARRFYESEALRGSWSVRQLDRQINSQFYERTALSKNKAAMLTKGAVPRSEDTAGLEEEIKDPYILEFLGLKDEYSETQLEDALIRHLETFLLELGADFAFLGRQGRLRIDDEWYRVDLLFFHRQLKCLVLIDLKLGRFTHADAGQMHVYLNYARQHWTRPGENPPVGLILCAQKGEALARYALDNLPNKVMAAEYRTALPDEELIAKELERTRRILDARRTTGLPASKAQRDRTWGRPGRTSRKDGGI